MIFWNKICGLLFLLLITGLFSPAQNIKLARSHTTFPLNNALNHSPSLIHFTSPASSVVTNWEHIKQIVPEDFYTCNIGFFCKKELLIEKTIKIPLRFRLGSLEQCNYYEGKKQ